MEEKKFSIPDKGKEFVNKWAKKIKPIIEREGLIYHFKDRCDHFNESFSWAAKPTTKANNLEEVARIRTLHTWAYYGFFKPTVAEVIQQIPEELLDQVDYFLIEGPDTADDLNKHKEELNAGFHVAETTLYKQC